MIDSIDYKTSKNLQKMADSAFAKTALSLVKLKILKIKIKQKKRVANRYP